MSEIVLRSVKGIATEEEAATLRSWRARSAWNERRYHELAWILLESEAALREEVAECDPPSMEHILSRNTETAPRLPAPTDDVYHRLTPPVRHAQPRFRFAVAALSAACVAGLATFGWLRTEPGSLTQIGPREVTTGIAETAIVRLGDGTVVRLGPESHLRIPESPARDGSRQIWLTGRAFLAVTKDPGGRAFLVRSHAGDATVLGTRFDIKVGEEDLRVLVVEGAVRMNAQGFTEPQLDVGPLQMGVVSPHHAPVRDDIDERALDDELKWLGNFLVFEATPLREVARELERRYGVPVTILDPDLEDETVRGMFLDETLRDVVDVVCRTVSVSCVVRESAVTIGP